ncbi:MAG: hypothetical protein HOP29_11100 [Phycisphaerales bacterium]|nr:hypothetical protein [Phycisphaerales bacterium]
MDRPRIDNEIVRVRHEVLVALKLVYPAALQADQLFRSLLAVFPLLEWNRFRRDVCYLSEKGYLQRVVAASERDKTMTPWRRRWFRVTPLGMEVADHLVGDPALNP